MVVGCVAAMAALLALSERANSVPPAEERSDRVENRAPTEVTNPAANDSAIERFQQLGVVPDDDFFVDDLARVPASSFPDGLSFDVTTGEIVFDGQRLIVERVPLQKRAGGTRSATSRRSPAEYPIRTREENFVGRMAFAESAVDGAGNIALDGPTGSMRIFVNERGELVFLVEPPHEDIDAFFPRMYVRSTQQAPSKSGGLGTVATDPAVDKMITCKCDKANCGGGCTKSNCDNIDTCSGRCGSCAWTTCSLCQ